MFLTLCNQKVYNAYIGQNYSLTQFSIMKISKVRKEQVNKAFSENALTMMRKRYLKKFDDGHQEKPADSDTSFDGLKNGTPFLHPHAGYSS